MTERNQVGIITLARIWHGTVIKTTTAAANSSAPQLGCYAQRRTSMSGRPKASLNSTNFLNTLADEHAHGLYVLLYSNTIMSMIFLKRHCNQAHKGEVAAWLVQPGLSHNRLTSPMRSGQVLYMYLLLHSNTIRCAEQTCRLIRSSQAQSACSAAHQRHLAIASWLQTHTSCHTTEPPQWGRCSGQHRQHKLDQKHACKCCCTATPSKWHCKSSRPSEPKSAGRAAPHWSNLTHQPVG